MKIEQRRDGPANDLPWLIGNAYLGKVVEKLLDFLLNQDNYRGVGRLFLP